MAIVRSTTQRAGLLFGWPIIRAHTIPLAQTDGGGFVEMTTGSADHTYRSPFHVSELAPYSSCRTLLNTHVRFLARHLTFWTH